MGDTFPFGKYKNYSVADVVAVDQQYIFWLFTKPFFRELYPYQHSNARRLLWQKFSEAVKEEDALRADPSWPANEMAIVRAKTQSTPQGAIA